MAVCLHCLHSARVEVQARRQRFLIRVLVGTLGLAVVVAVGGAGVGAFQGKSSLPGAGSPRAKGTSSKGVAVKPVASTLAAAISALQQGTHKDTLHAPTPSPTLAVDSARPSTSEPPTSVPVGATATARTTPPNSEPPVAPVLAEGRTELPDSLFVVRTGSTVVVYFDTSPTRTRRADKFDRIVRQTLRAVYGSVADSVLALIPDGTLAAPRDLVTELPTRGIHLPLANGWKISLWPETRPGRDGPLVVAYRTVVAR